MYQMSQTYSKRTIYQSISRLETITSEYQTRTIYTKNTFYSTSATMQSQSFQDLFMPKYTPSLNQLNQLYNNQISNYQLFKTEKNYSFIPQTFLKPDKEGIFVGEVEEIKDFIEETFEKMFNCKFPNNIKISILNKNKFAKISKSENALGLSINRNQYNLLSEIFILNGSLGRVMLTIGHELGHVLTNTLNNQHDEEAKAYAFSLAWMEVIKNNNIANLKDAIITENPAQNGLHNIAFNFIHNLIKKGKKAPEIYTELIKKKLNVKDNFLIE